MFKRLTEFGFPRSFIIVQFPNLPLILAFVTGAASGMTHGNAHAYLLAVAFTAMIIWAFEELSSGVNWFRHALGAAYIIILIMRIAHALPH